MQKAQHKLLALVLKRPLDSVTFTQHVAIGYIPGSPIFPKQRERHHSKPLDYTLLLGICTICSSLSTSRLEFVSAPSVYGTVRSLCHIPGLSSLKHCSIRSETHKPRPFEDLVQLLKTLTRSFRYHKEHVEEGNKTPASEKDKSSPVMHTRKYGRGASANTVVEEPVECLR